MRWPGIGIVRSGGAGLAGEDSNQPEVGVIVEMFGSGRGSTGAGDFTTPGSLLVFVVKNFGGEKDVNMSGLVLGMGKVLSSVE